jgi:hypothetical protein
MAGLGPAEVESCHSFERKTRAYTGRNLRAHVISVGCLAQVFPDKVITSSRMIFTPPLTTRINREYSADQFATLSNFDGVIRKDR